MKNKYTHARTCVYNINYHIVWCVKYRRKVLTPEISSRLYEPSSQICHCCRKKHPEMKDLRIRIFTCDCGFTISRDQNAALNIKSEGLRILKSETFAA